MHILKLEAHASGDIMGYGGLRFGRNHVNFVLEFSNQYQQDFAINLMHLSHPIDI